MKKYLLSLLSLFLLLEIGFAQSIDTVLVSKLKKHISTLASDAFEGRETGTKGEQLSYQYIISEFKKAGLQPKGTLEFLQPFPFTRSIKPGKENFLKINGSLFNLGDDFYPLSMSGNTAIGGMLRGIGFGISAPALGYDDYKSKNRVETLILLMHASYPDGAGPHSRFAAFDLNARIDTAIAHGAAAVIVINSDKEADNPPMIYKNKAKQTSIPVVFAQGRAYDSLVNPNCSAWTIEVKTDLVKENATGNNIIGYIDNKAASTVVIGAHYDHLGFGDEESSLYRGAPAIHNGADDNASGVAALIEIAKTLKNSPDKSNNYLFIAFSGEEKGLLGSNYFMKNSTVPLDKINYMINMDMVGRLKTEEPTLLINGVGTSPAWKITMDYIKLNHLKIKTTESGVGPSDQTSFYLKNIPALHFFSGTHSDYHKPSDDEPLINYNGETQIIQYILELIHRLNDKGKLEFTKTKDEDSESAPRFKVTLGVIPDYAFEGEGMRIDGISEGRPASKAGLLQGDIVIQLGDYNVTDMTSYMKALGMFKKGDTTTVKVKRGNEEKTTDITF